MIIYIIILYLVSGVSGATCESSKLCTDFSYKKDDLVICSSPDKAEIWNTTSGECNVQIEADLQIVSYMSIIFTLGVTPAVRHPIGDECWDYVPEKIAQDIIDRTEHFNVDSVCSSHPLSSPSLGWEMRYVGETRGYSDCASLVVLHDDYLVSCVRLHADARALATFAYMISVLLGFFIGIAILCIPLYCLNSLLEVCWLSRQIP